MPPLSAPGRTAPGGAVPGLPAGDRTPRPPAGSLGVRRHHPAAHGIRAVPAATRSARPDGHSDGGGRVVPPGQLGGAPRGEGVVALRGGRGRTGERGAGGHFLSFISPTPLS